LLGIATLGMGHLSVISSNPILGIFQKSLVITLIPGLIPSVAVGSLWIGALVNAIFYFGVVWAISSLWRRFRRKQANGKTSLDYPLG
jgi:uncharacterized protein (DUF2062 family)